MAGTISYGDIYPRSPDIVGAGAPVPTSEAVSGGKGLSEKPLIAYWWIGVLVLLVALRFFWEKA